MHSGTIVHLTFNWVSGAGDFWFYCWTQSLIIILIKLKSHKDKCHGYGSILYLGCFLVTQKNGQKRMDEADKNVSTFYKHLTNHSGLFHIFTRREESRCSGLRSTCSKFKMTVVQTIRSHVKHFFRVNDSSWALISGILEKNKTRRWIHHVKKIK